MALLEHAHDLQSEFADTQSAGRRGLDGHDERRAAATVSLAFDPDPCKRRDQYMYVPQDSFKLVQSLTALVDQYTA